MSALWRWLTRFFSDTDQPEEHDQVQEQADEGPAPRTYRQSVSAIMETTNMPIDKHEVRTALENGLWRQVTVRAIYVSGVKMMASSPSSPRFQQTISVIVETTVPTDATEVKRALEEELSINVLAASVSLPERVTE